MAGLILLVDSRLLILLSCDSIDWPQEEAEAPNGGSGNDHLWEESWDDDDASEDFSKQLACVTPAHDIPPSFLCLYIYIYIYIKY